MDKPRWLDDEPEILALLDAFLDKLDRRPAREWQQPPAIGIDQKSFPSLYRNDAGADRQWALLKSLDGVVLDLRLARKRAPYSPEYAGARVQLRLAAEDDLRHWLDRPRSVPYAVQWRQAVTQYTAAFADAGAALAARTIQLEGKSASDLVAAFARIAHHIDADVSLRQLSARCFWGHSKFLDDRTELLSALFPSLRILPRPILVNVFLPKKFDGALFIENQDTYSRAIGGSPAEAGSLALVFASGFRGSAQRIREPSGVCLHYYGGIADAQRTAFESWWFDIRHSGMPVWFWGDLDYSGLAILKVLRTRFGDVRAWKPGYRPMLDVILAGGGHTRKLANKEDQAHPGITGCVFADQVLLPAIEQHDMFVDQEAV